MVVLEGQLDLLDLLAAEEERITAGRAYIAREMAREPDTPRTLTCPWCGYTSDTTAWCMDTYHCWKEHDRYEEPGVCFSMWLLRNHVRYAISIKSEKDLKTAAARAYASWGERAKEFIPPEYWELMKKEI